jgi:hypothetical protein
MSKTEQETNEVLNEILRVKNEIYLLKEKYNDIYFTKRPSSTSQSSSFFINSSKLQDQKGHNNEAFETVGNSLSKSFHKKNFYDEKSSSIKRAKTALILRKRFCVK